MTTNIPTFQLNNENFVDDLLIDVSENNSGQNAQTIYSRKVFIGFDLVASECPQSEHYCAAIQEDVGH